MRMVIAPRTSLAVFSACLVALSLPGLLRAEEAVLPDGHSLRGKLKLEDGRFQFVTSARKTTSLEEIDHVRFPAAKVASLRAARLSRLTLTDGQRLTGELLGLDDKAVRFRPAWAPILTIPRPAVASITQLPGFQTFFDEDFEGDLKAWKVTGKAALSAGKQVSGKQSLLLSGAGQAAEYGLATPLKAGRAAISYYDPLNTRGNRWLVEAEFQEDKTPRTLRIGVAADPEKYTAEVPGADQKAWPVARREGWHRLQVEFSPRMLLITVDEEVLWVSRLRGPGGSLHKVRLVCSAGPGDVKPRGEVHFDDLSLSRAVPALRHQRADPGQDELWLLSGDQILGSLTRADRRTIDWKARFGKRTWSWGDVRGLFLRQQPDSPRTSDGEHIQVWLCTGADAEADRVAGPVRAWDEKRLTLRHPILGELAIDRTRIRRLRWSFHGRRIALDHSSHLLGPKGKLVASIHPSRAEGIRKEWSFRLDTVPEATYLRLQVVHLKGPDDGIAQALDAGELRTQVLVNGWVVDYLNRHVRRSSRTPRQLSIRIPRKHLREGKNTLVLRQTPEKETKHYESCSVADLALEMPR
jgi:hypothetical protein